MTSDARIRAIMTGSLPLLAIRGLAVACGFALNVLIARALGTAGAGVYFLALGFVTAATVLGRLGMDNAVLRFVAAAAVKREWRTAAAVIRVSARTALAASLLITGVLVVCAPCISRHFFDKAELVPTLRILAIGVVPLSLLNLFSEGLRGIGRVTLGALFQALAMPAAGLVLVGAGFFYVSRPQDVAAIYLLGAIAAAGMALRFLRAEIPVTSGTFPLRRLLATSAPLFWVSAMTLVMSWSDIMMLGLWRNSSTVGIYAVAAKTAAAVSFFLIAVNGMAAPQFAGLYAEGKLSELAYVARRTTALIAGITFPVLIVILLFSRTILALFGPEFVAASPALLILATGHFVNAVTGSVGYLLMMTGHERIVRTITILAAGLNIILNLLLIPRYGTIGAAVATATSLAVMNIGCAIMVWAKLDIVTLPRLH